MEPERIINGKMAMVDEDLNNDDVTSYSYSDNQEKESAVDKTVKVCYESDYEYDEEEEEEENEASMSFAVDPPWSQVVCKRTTSSNSLDTATCAFCGREEHTPAMDCDMVSRWLELTSNKHGTSMSVDAQCIKTCMQRVVQECVQKLPLRSLGGNSPDHIYNASPELVAVELRRFRWDVENWRYAVLSKCNLEYRLRQVPHQERSQVLQRIDDLGFEQGIRMPNGWEDNTLRIEQEHQEPAMEEEIITIIPVASKAPSSSGQSTLRCADHAAMETTRTEMPMPAATACPDDSCRDSNNASACDQKMDPDCQCTVQDRTAHPPFASMKTQPETLTPDASEGSFAIEKKWSNAQTECMCKSPPGDDCAPTKSIWCCQACGKARSLVTALLIKPLARMMGRSTQNQRDGTSSSTTAMLNKESVDLTLQSPTQHDSTTTIHDWTCEICMDDDVHEEDRLCMECGHEYCRSCWGNYIKAKLERTRASGGVQYSPELCPHDLCRQKITRHHVEHFSPHLLALYDELTLNSFVMAHNRTMRWCPGPGCGNVVVHWRTELLFPDHDARFTHCNECLTQFCFDCGAEPHEGQRCTPVWFNVVNQQQHPWQQNNGTNAPAVGGSGGNKDNSSFWVEATEVPDYEHQNSNPLQQQHPSQQSNCNGAAAGNQDNSSFFGESTAIAKDGHQNSNPLPPKVLEDDMPEGCGEQVMRLTSGSAKDRNLRTAEKTSSKKIHRCSSCKVPIEKNGGCNRITCKCGTQFCWLCQADTTGTTHFCGREPAHLDKKKNRIHDDLKAMGQHSIDLDYVMETVQMAEFACPPDVVETAVQRQKESSRFAHYYNRYIAHDQGQCFAENQCECFTGRALIYAHVSELQCYSDTDFVSLSNQRLVASRRMLKYTYCFLYFKLAVGNSNKGDVVEVEESEYQVDNTSSRSLPVALALSIDHQVQLFLDHQERLERMTEQLSCLSENALTRTDRQRVMDMITTVDRCMQALMELSFD